MGQMGHRPPPADTGHKPHKQDIERTALSKNKAAMLKKGQKALPEDIVTPGPVGLILCARKDEAVARYALEGLPNKVMAAEYRTALPDEKTLAAEIRRTQEILLKRETLALPPWDEIRVKKTAERKRGTKSTGGNRK